MTQITFTSKEKIFLQELIKQRLHYCSIENFKKKYITLLESVAYKISNYNATHYNSGEISTIKSCINEYYTPICKKLKQATWLSWLTISDEQKDVVCNLDNCTDILLKLESPSVVLMHENGFRFRNILTAIEKIKKSSKVFFSRISESSYYKIAFIYEEQEYLPFELGSAVSLYDAQFVSFRGKSTSDILAEKFSLILTREKAKELVATFKCDNHPKGVIEFINTLLA